MILSVIEESVLWLMSVSYISLMWFEISRKLIPRPYMPKIFFSRLSAKIVSRFLTSWGSKLDRRSRWVSISIVPSEVRIFLLDLPLLRLPMERWASSIWLSISASNAASKNFFIKGAKAPFLPYSDSPLRNCSRALSFMDSKPKSLSLILIITMSKIILLFIILDTVYFTVSKDRMSSLLDYRSRFVLVIIIRGKSVFCDG